MKTYSYSVHMAGFEPVSGLHSASRSHDAEVVAIKAFLDKNDIEKPIDTTWSELIRFYAPVVKIAQQKK